MAGKKIETAYSADVKRMGEDQLGNELKSLRMRLFTLRSQSVTEKIEDSSQFGITKRNIARVLTEQNARRKPVAK